tara:strand:+ start:116 stop:382 length:267 start_codon:yes stop_codon:yes gene_type:complete
VKIGKAVWLTGQKKADGRINCGKIVGVELLYEGLYFSSKKQFIDGHAPYKYKVAYIDVFTNKGASEWVHHTDVSFIKPVEQDDIGGAE